MAEYSKHSPWYRTTQTIEYLSYIEIRSVAAESDDYRYTIETQYHLRPDLLAYDLYGTSKLWWVFTQRNMDILQDPLFDFVAGISIYIPKKTTLFKMLGI